MWDGFNKRKFPRINLECEIEILSQEQTSPISTITENIGIGGVCVILDKALERFSKCRLKLNLGDKRGFQCDGKIVWIVPTRLSTKGSKKSFDIGIEFTDLTPDQNSQVRYFLDKECQKIPAK